MVNVTYIMAIQDLPDTLMAMDSYYIRYHAYTVEPTSFPLLSLLKIAIIHIVDYSPTVRKPVLYPTSTQKNLEFSTRVGTIAHR